MKKSHDLIKLNDFSPDLLAVFADPEAGDDPAGHIQTPLLGRGGQCGEMLSLSQRLPVPSTFIPGPQVWARVPRVPGGGGGRHPHLLLH